MTSVAREGLNIDHVARFLRSTLLNEYLALPIATLACWLRRESSATHFASLIRLVSSYGGYLDKARVEKVGSIALALGAAGTLFSINDWLTKWAANNWRAIKRGEWDWDREIVLVTGASGGLGASVVQGLLARNPRTTIVIIDFAPMAWTPPVDAKVHYYQADLSDTAAIKAVCARVRAEVGHPTVLVNNAGIARGFTILDGSYADVELTIKTNLTAPFLMIKEFLPDMVKHNHGHIVSICSMSAIAPPPGIADYSASKAGIQAMHEALQLELKHRHNAPSIRLTNGIFNFIRTPLFKGETGLPSRLAPLLHVDTVGDAIVNSLYSGYGGTLYLPGIMRYISMLRGAPEWMLRILRESTVNIPVDFKGRQKIDEKTGALRSS
ncbi:hypothetical protein B0H63DRAFT_414541 [Podospora didyma]|uniref:Dehydrogenase n=1 Tax=Podospora didyma TaxID=330526 RepID=A0AAE0NPT0_9PEZI|nr:hypothetical protein B0H63DRAFT_414541 [Podospora didyma]